MISGEVIPVAQIISPATRWSIHAEITFEVSKNFALHPCSTDEAEGFVG